MSLRFWLVLGLLGVVLILLIASGDTGTTLGFETNVFASAAVSGLWALVIGWAVLTNGPGLAQSIKQISVWVVIILALMAAYVFRYDAQDLAARFSGGIVPGSPISRLSDAGRHEVTIVRSTNGHFEVVAGVDKASVRFLIDTGATSIVLAAQDAKAAGIDVDSLRFDIPIRTANGTGYSAIARVGQLYVGGIERNNVEVMIAEPGRLSQSLLGQQFLESLASYEKRGDRLTLRD